MADPDRISDFQSSPVGYDRRLIAFFDVLGWRSAIDRAGGDPTQIGRLALLLRLFSAAFVPQGARNSGARLSSFSDNVVVSFPLRLEELSWRLRNIAMIQVGVAIIGFSLRGAVTIGHIHHDEHIVFGPGLVRAYELESSVAFYPRIMLDDDAPELLEIRDELIARDGDLRFLDPFIPHIIDQNGPGDRVDRDFDAFNSYFGEQLAPP